MEDWNIFFNAGLGKLKFGMSPAEVALHDPIYGGNPIAKEYGNSAETLVEDLGDFAEFFSDDILQGAAEASRRFDEETSILFSELRQTPYVLNLEYVDRKLTSIGLRQDCLVLNHSGFYIFEHSAKQCLEYFQNLNGGAQFFEDQALFDKIGILLSGFYYQNDSGSWRFFNENSAENTQRFITVFAPSELQSYLNSDFSDVDFSSK